MIAAELASATNIKDRLNRHAVLDSLTAIKNALKTYRDTPPNGLGIFAGAGRLEFVTPSAPLRLSTYRCDRRFHVDDVLAAHTSCGDPVGIVILDGNGVITGICDGTRRTILNTLRVELPKKHNKGGQSAQRFGRLAEEARANYRTKAVELSVRAFMREGLPWVRAIVVGGVGDLKHRFVEELPESLRTRVHTVMELAYGGQEGFAMACVESERTMAHATLTCERTAISAIEEEIALDRGLYVLGRANVEEAIAAGCVAALLLDAEAPDCEAFIRRAMEMGTAPERIQPITRVTPEGMRFVTGLSGYGALLRWPWVGVGVGVGVEVAAVVATGGGRGDEEDKDKDKDTMRVLRDEEVNFM